jgi:signal peptidase I
MKTWLTKQWSENKGLFVFILLMFMFRSAIADWNDVPTGSMKPTIMVGDRIFVNKLAYDVTVPFTPISLYKIGDPERGDIIVFNSEVTGDRMVKRVVGTPGDTVAMRNNRVYLNGEPLDYTASDNASEQSSARHADYTELLPGQPHIVRIGEGPGLARSFDFVVVPEGHYLALGDNRDNSSDSRVIGFIPREEIVGRAKHVVMSLDYDNYYLPRPERFFAAL